VPTKQWRPSGLLVLGRGLPGATAAAAGMREPSLRKQEPWGLLASVGYQELWQLPQTWGNQACRQWEFWGLTVGRGFWEYSAVALLLAWGNQAHCLAPCYPWSSGIHGSCLYRGASSPGISGWRYQIRLCCVELQVPVCARKQDLLMSTKKWNLEPCGDFREKDNQEDWAASHSFHSSHG
jgi:hypothetical protein